MKKNKQEHEAERIGMTLRTLRELRGFTQDEFANELLISRPYLTNIELGRKPLSEKLLARSAEILNVRPIAIIREGYFDANEAVRQIEENKLRKDLEAARDQIKRMSKQLEALSLRLPQGVTA